MSSRLVLGATLLVAVAQLACTTGAKTTSCKDGLKDNGSGKCVECTALADCAAGTFCNASNVCDSCASSPASCAVPDGGSSNGSCATSADCTGGKVCKDFQCADGCTTNAACGTGKYCDTATHECATGCGADAQCSGLSCCPDTHTCVDTQTNPAANCGGCGAPACATGNSCCSGACADFQTDKQNCGSCGNACSGNIECVAGVCQDGYGLFGLFSLTGKTTGDATSKEILKPFLYTRTGALDYQALAARACFATHFDAEHPQTAELDAGNVLFSGFAGGTFLDSMVAPTDIACQFIGGDYHCGYGMLMDNMLGAATGQSPFAAGTHALGAGMLTVAAPGGATFGSFNLTASPGTGLGVREDLSTVTYAANVDTTINIDITCPPGGCSGAGYLIYVQATSNDVAHFDEASTSGGSMVCLGGYGKAFGVLDLGAPTIVLPGADIATMLGGDATLKTFQTTVVTLDFNDLQDIAGGRMTDSQGHQVIALERTGSFGVSSSAVTTSVAAQ